MSSKKISLTLAILININIVVGSAFFINAPKIVQMGGGLSPLVWIFVGLLLLPLVFVLASLSKEYPYAGGMYSYTANSINRFWGFFSGWSYFIGTAAGNALVIHEFAKLISESFGIFRFLDSYNLPHFLVDLIFIVFFAFLNLFNLELLGKLQVLFTTLKAIPFILIIISAFWIFDISNFNAVSGEHFSGLVSTIPLVFFAFIGIEACCAIGHSIQNAKKNTARAIFISFAITVLVYTLAQLLLVGILASEKSESFFDIFYRLNLNPIILNFGKIILTISLLCSYLGGFYSMFYTNNWTLFAMAKERSVPFAQVAEKLNKFGTPIAALFFQTSLIIFFLSFTSSIEYLSAMSDFGVVITYGLSVVSFFILIRKKSIGYKLIGIAALLSCLILLAICFKSLLTIGISFLIPFLILILLGFIGFFFKKQF